MRISTVPACLVAALLLAIAGCAKPPVRSYPRPAASDTARRPLPPAAEKDAPRGTRPSDAAPPDAATSAPAAPYDKPLATIGTRPSTETGGDHLLAVVTPLADQARRQLASGELETAQTTAERAVRIDPSNADLWHLMGKIQLARANFGQAEQLARKSNLLAKGDTQLQARNWRLIAEARRGLNDVSAAAEALKKAHTLESR